MRLRLRHAARGQEGDACATTKSFSTRVRAFIYDSAVNAMALPPSARIPKLKGTALL
jgi:hypothetical protein